jgi:hypothetical protein
MGKKIINQSVTNKLNKGPKSYKKKYEKSKCYKRILLPSQSIREN